MVSTQSSASKNGTLKLFVLFLVWSVATVTMCNGESNQQPQLTLESVETTDCADCSATSAQNEPLFTSRQYYNAVLRNKLVEVLKLIDAIAVDGKSTYRPGPDVYNIRQTRGSLKIANRFGKRDQLRISNRFG